MTKKRPTPRKPEEPMMADPLTFEQIVESLVAPLPPKDKDIEGQQK